EGWECDYSGNLTSVSERLGRVKDREGVRAIVESLVLATREMETKNLGLQGQLQALAEEVGQLREDLETIRSESVTDALTGLGNRKFFNASLEKSVAQCHAENAPLALLLADVDFFKKINDSYGHVVGDRVLRFVANVLKRGIKGKDVAARYGGGGCGGVLAGTPLAGAMEVAEQLRVGVMKGE